MLSQRRTTHRLALLSGRDGACSAGRRLVPSTAEAYEDTAPDAVSSRAESPLALLRRAPGAVVAGRERRCGCAQERKRLSPTSLSALTLPPTNCVYASALSVSHSPGRAQYSNSPLPAFQLPSNRGSKICLRASIKHTPHIKIISFPSPTSRSFPSPPRPHRLTASGARRSVGVNYTLSKACTAPGAVLL